MEKLRETLVRSIKAKSILVMSEVQLRFAVDREHIEKFKEAYRLEEELHTELIPPIELFLVQTGDPKEQIYPLSDGFNRLTAQKELGRKEVRAIVKTEVLYTKEHLEILPLKTKLLNKLKLRNMFHNVKNGKSLSKEECKKGVQVLYKDGESLDNIAETGVASRSTLHRWLEPVIKAKKEAAAEEKRKEKGKIIEIISKAPSERAAAKELQKEVTGAVPKNLASLRTRVRLATGKLKNNGGVGTKSQMGLSTHPSKKTSHPSPHLKNVPALFTQPKPASDKNYADRIIHAISQIVDEAPHSEHLEDRMRLEILELIRNKFPTIDDLYQKQPDSLETRCLRDDYNALYASVKKKNIEITQLKDLLTAKEDQLRARTTACSQQCGYTYDRLKKESIRFLEFIIARVKEHTEALPRISGGRENELTLKKLTYQLLLPAISMFEWAAENGRNLTTPHTIKLFEDFVLLLKSSNLANKVINERIKWVRGFFTKMEFADIAFQIEKVAL